MCGRCERFAALRAFSRVALARECQGENDHSDAQSEVQPVVGIVQRQDVQCAALVHKYPAYPQRGVGDSAGQQVGARCGVGARENEADHAERQMDNVVQSGHREHPEQLRAGMIAGPSPLVKVVVTPGMKLRTPTIRNAAATNTAAPCTAMTFGRRAMASPPSDPLIDGSAGERIPGDGPVNRSGQRLTLQLGGLPQ